ncbi:hypothetical protein [Mycobacterium sp.]|uniref:hypothetical protein n=1 Tax=Mycobacterium sp. TaxID=1785 RepID=UPI002DAE223B|nr:hypothetical protein [Mycobacterium sp.]
MPSHRTISVAHDTDNTLTSHYVSDSSTTIDGAKKVDGIKRHVLVDSVGVLIAAVVTVDVVSGPKPAAVSSFNPAAESSNAPTAGSTTAAA